MALFEDLVKTYQGDKRWNDPFFTPEQMAIVGLRYLGINDIVKCVHCNVELDKWTKKDDPYMKHKLYSPSCPIFENKSKDKFHRAQLEWSIFYQKIDRSIIKREFAYFDKRLVTFEKCKKKLNQDPRSLCDAGFYYRGNGRNDDVACFCCFINLYDWETDDDPWAEHAKANPNCIYLLLKKGKIFVVKVYEAANLLTFNNKPLRNSLSDSPDLAQELKMTPKKSKLTNEEPTGQQKYISEPDETLECKVCLAEESNIVIVPCGHFLGCISCALSLDKCPICRDPFEKVIKAIPVTDGRIDDPSRPGSSSQSSNSIARSIICRVCYKNEIKTLYVPCRHLVSCLDCAFEAEKCTICNVRITERFQVYL